MTCAFSLISVPYSLQIKVRDLSRASVSISPAEFGTWSQARSELLLEAKRPLKAQLQAELAAAADETAAEEIRAAFQAREKALEVRIASLAHSRPLLLPALATFQT